MMRSGVSFWPCGTISESTAVPLSPRISTIEKSAFGNSSSS